MVMAMFYVLLPAATISTPLSTDLERSGGAMTTADGRGGEDLNLDTTGNTLDEEKDNPTQPYHEFVHPARASKRFGLKGSAPYQYPKGNDSSNYEEKYPEDAYCEETGQNARVFRTYLDERTIYDANMVEESRDGVDVLLVFAGLFSAVATTFLVQTSQSLQEDYAEMSANLLFEMINIQRAVASGASLDSVAASPLNPNTTFIASTTSVRVNGLWFTSLALSLTTALVSVLVKQWLHHYMALPSGTPRERSLLRQFRFAGLQKWCVLVIIGLLPVLMHAALAIFFVGLVIFLGPLCESIAWVVGTITAVAYTAYLMVHILPLFVPQCPYRTSLCDLLHVLYSRVMQYAIHKLMRCGVRWAAFYAVQWKDLKALESDAVQSVSGELSVEALHWLFSMSSNPTVQSIVLQAIGGLLPALQSKAQGLFNDTDSVLCHACVECLARPSPMSRKLLSGLETKLERLLRCKLFLSDESYILIDPSQTPGVERPPNVTASVEKHLHHLGGNLFMKEVICNAASSVLRSSMDECWCFHPLVWIDLIKNGPSKEVFSSIDISTQDPFAIDVCCAVLPAFRAPLASYESATMDIANSSSTAIPFHTAISHYLFTDTVDYFLRTFVVFVRPSNVPSISPSLRILLVFAEFLLSRFSLKEQAGPVAVELRALSAVLDSISNQNLSSSEANAAVFDILDRFIADTLKSIRSEADASLHLHLSALRIYSTLVHTQWHVMRPRSLEAVINVMFDHYNSNHYVPMYAGEIIARCFHEGSPTMYNVFHASRCLEYFGHHGCRPWLLEIIKGYLSVFERHSNSRIEASVVQGHIEYLHTPDILFDVCSILAIGSDDLREEDCRKQIKWNILSLARIRRDAPVWGDCRCRLRQLLEEDGMSFFYRQTRIDGIERVSLSAEEIVKQRKRICFAIETLNAFFLGTLDDEPENGPSDYIVVIPDPSPISQTRATWREHLHRLLPWPRGQREASDDDAVEGV
ncbi:hypothetical protein EDD85DRAFT_949742 [Armillaria nabsnona]|nr:hypothetical protein EDD85DRAFT_949742 [Armillaria nabsnona]